MVVIGIEKFFLLFKFAFYFIGNIIIRTVEILNRESFEELIVCDGAKLAEKRSEIMKIAKRNADWLHKLFCASSMSSIVFSYLSAFAVPGSRFDENLNVTVTFREKPYTSWSPLDVEKTRNFVIDAAYQCYAITFGTACFACMIKQIWNGFIVIIFFFYCRY